MQRMASILGTLGKTRKIWRKDRIFGASLAGAFLRLQLGYSFWYKFTGQKSFCALGQKFHAFSPASFLALFEEIYVGQPYAFSAPHNDPVILDCGSNIGISVLFFKKIFPSARILAFEPDPATFALLQKNIDANTLPNVIAHQIALSDQDGEITFYNDPSSPGNLCMSIDPNRMSKASVTVPTKRLSSFIDREIDYAKIDVEGAEHMVMDDLISSGKLLRIKQLFIEYHHHIKDNEDRLGGMLKALEDHGFGYQLATANNVPQTARHFQDVLIYAYRK